MLGGMAGIAIASRNGLAAGQLAWPGPIGLELFMVRELLAEDPASTLKQVASIGYKEVELGPKQDPGKLDADLRAAGLTAVSSYFSVPKTLDDWKEAVDMAHGYGLRYIVVGDNPRLDADAWKRHADFFNECGRVSLASGIQFCYHAHFHEFAATGGTSGYDILLTHCDPKLLKMEMDIFWVIYAGKDPIHYWQSYPGRFPLLHIKDLRKGVAIHHQEPPSEAGPNPFAPVGQGTIDWPRIFSHVHEAGAHHIFVEQDRCTLPPIQAMKISYDYLRNLRLA
jgi:sugar phosphate isomerase/epimerase